MSRSAEFSRKTKETDVSVYIELDRVKEISINTGIPFLDHMLENFAKHSKLTLNINAMGDLEVDEHHTVEDVAIALGKALAEALGDRKGVRRFGSSIVPMDDAVAICGVDISGRGYFNFDGKTGDVKGIKGENFEHFFDTLCRNSGINVYLNVKGKNSHHIMEAAFKAFAVAFRDARVVEGEDIPSTKEYMD
ncbi:MAG: imidazoleglycerol-phosphate dehydratase HisB [Archaeoglobus sp.]|jgi:imidazoleglycerol-phosphate dehydratase|nr:MAG: imidazoleglycerol-phosphate dehydratase HisB [Archaeoglobus sp.]